MFRAQVDNTLFLTLQLSNLLLLLSFSIRKHTFMASRTILSNFFEEQRTQNNPQYFSGLSRTLRGQPRPADNLSRNTGKITDSLFWIF